jgi:hypothetical protein
MQVHDHHMRVLSGEPDERRIDGARQFAGVQVGDGRSVRAVGDLIGA